jgi:phosphatidylserine synthase
MEPIVDAVVYVISPSGSGYAELATLLSAIAAFASVIVACVAVRLSHKQIKMFEQHNRLMATPHLSAWNRTDKKLKAYFFTLENNGLGPAIA